MTGIKGHPIRQRVAHNDDEARRLSESQRPRPYRVVALLWFPANPYSVRDDSGNCDNTRYTSGAPGGVIPHPVQLRNQGILFESIHFVAIPVMWRRARCAASDLSALPPFHNISCFGLLYSSDGYSIPNLEGRKCLQAFWIAGCGTAPSPQPIPVRALGRLHKHPRPCRSGNKSESRRTLRT